MRRLFLVAMLAAPFAFSQAQTGFPLEKIEITGNDAIPAERIAVATGLKIGSPVERADFNTARDRLLATGAFSSVGFKYGPSAASTGIDATFQVVEAQPLYPYRFEELPATEAALREALRKQEPIFGDAIVPTPQVMNRYAVAIAEYLANNSSPGIQVIGEVSPDVNAEPSILFRPMGERKVISQVDFKGNSALPIEDLRKRINLAAIGTRYSETLFHQILDSSIRGLYEEHGYVRVVFPKIETARSTRDDGVAITVTVEEGQQYTLGDVTVTGVDPPQASQLNRMAGWKKGAGFDIETINAGIAKIRKSFREDGYLRVSATTKRDIDDDKRVVDLEIAIEPGPLFTMGKLTVRGLDIISEPVIRKLWKLNEGDPYRESYPDVFVQMIKDEDYFDNLARTGVEADLRENNSVDVTLTFFGAKAAAERFGKQR